MRGTSGSRKRIEKAYAPGRGVISHDGSVLGILLPRSSSDGSQGRADEQERHRVAHKKLTREVGKAEQVLRKFASRVCNRNMSSYRLTFQRWRGIGSSGSVLPFSVVQGWS